MFNTTLDLSQEDIQQTLSANMPIHRNEKSVVHSTTNFVDSFSSRVQEEDDSFVNLDAFDMLIELPELESCKNNMIEKNDHSLQIAEFCPEWSFVDGGVKILITGPWVIESTYTAYFDSISVPTTVVQTGVLKLFAPRHEPGVCKVCISDGFSFSNIVDFEYKIQPNLECGLIEILYKFNLKSRLEAINNELCAISTNSSENYDSGNLFDDPDFENHLIEYCQKTIANKWNVPKVDSLSLRKFKGMTVLHLAAALGYSNLIGLLLEWTKGSHHSVVKSEINVKSQNQEGNTPLMEAGLHGRLDAGKLVFTYS